MADRPGAKETVRHLRLTLGRDFFVTTTIATEGVGVPELRDALEERWGRLQDGEGLARLRARKRAREAALVAEAWVRSCADEIAEENLDLNSAVKRILEEAARRWTT
jgi:LAO/AO transport system kinase